MKNINLKKRRLIVIFSSIIGLSFAYLIYFFLVDNGLEKDNYIFAILGPVAIILSMSILIYSLINDKQMD